MSILVNFELLYDLSWELLICYLFLRQLLELWDYWRYLTEVINNYIAFENTVSILKYYIFKNYYYIQ